MRLNAGTQEMWVAAWGSTIDPDMYQVYYSGNIVGLPGSSESNHYHIQDAELDQLILDAPHERRSVLSEIRVQVLSGYHSGLGG